MGMINFETSAQRSNERRKHPGTNGNGRRYSRDVALSEPHIVNNSISSPQSRLLLFEEVILPHLNAAYNLARWLTRNEYDAQDVVQEAYLRAFRFFDSYKGGDGKSWLLEVVRNTCFTFHRLVVGRAHRLTLGCAVQRWRPGALRSRLLSGDREE